MTHTDSGGKVGVVVVGTTTAFAVQMVAAVERMAGPSQIVRDWRMDLKLGSALRTSCAAPEAEAEAYKRQDAVVELEERGS